MASNNINALAGTWVMEKSENFDEMMKELGVNFMLRKVASTVTPTLIIKHEGGTKWSIKMQSTVKNDDDEFNLNEEFDKDTNDGRKVKAVVREIDGKIVGEQRDRKTGKLQLTSTKYVNAEGKLIEENVVNSVKCVRTFKRA